MSRKQLITLAIAGVAVYFVMGYLRKQQQTTTTTQQQPATQPQAPQVQGQRQYQY